MAKLGLGLGLTRRGGVPALLPAVDTDILATDADILSLNAPVNAGAVAGHNMHYWGSYAHSEATIDVCGRAVTANVMSSSGDVVSLWVDGVKVDETTGADIWEELTYSPGGGDVWRTVTIKNAVLPVAQYCRVRTADMLTVSSAAGTVKRFPAAYSQTLKDMNAAGVRLDGFAADGGGLNGYSRSADWGNSFRFRAAPTAAKPYLHVYASDVNDWFALFQDGVTVDQILLSPGYANSQLRKWHRLTPSNPDGTERLFEIKSGRNADEPNHVAAEYAPGIAPSVYKISAEGFVAGSTPAARVNWGVWGDSIAWGYGHGAEGTNQFTWESFASQIVRAKGKNEYNWSQSGDDWADYAASPSLAGSSIDILLIPSLGVNDYLNGTTIANFKAAIYTALNRILADVATMVYYIPILPTTAASGGGGTLAQYRTAAGEVMTGGATTAGTLTGGQVAKITVLPVSTIDPSDTDMSGDGLHFLQAGNDFLFDEYEPLLP
jgi:hypothetical protein